MMVPRVSLWSLHWALFLNPSWFGWSGHASSLKFGSLFRNRLENIFLRQQPIVMARYFSVFVRSLFCGGVLHCCNWPVPRLCSMLETAVIINQLYNNEFPRKFDDYDLWCNMSFFKFDYSYAKWYFIIFFAMCLSCSEAELSLIIFKF